MFKNNCFGKKKLLKFRGKSTKMVHSIKNSKYFFTVTEFFILIKTFYILVFLIFQGLIHEIKISKTFHLFQVLTWCNQ